MLTVKWKNLSGHWFQDEYPDPMGFVVYEWKKNGGVCLAVEIHNDTGLVDFWEKV